MFIKFPLFSRLTRLTRVAASLRSRSMALAAGGGSAPAHRCSVAPMMEYTNMYQRYLMRLISKKMVLYTEMVTSMALVNSGKQPMGFRADLHVEDPVVLQLGGSCPDNMRAAALVAKEYGYQELNINVGCPSPKVAGAGSFGAALMLEADLVSRIAAEMRGATGLPVTVKCRIGVNSADSYEELARFTRVVHDSGGVDHFIVHARKAILDASFSPADNRSIPPLNYPAVYALSTDFPSLSFTINGGISNVEAAVEHLNTGKVSGVMVGRAVNEDPFRWSTVDKVLYGCEEDTLSRYDVIEKYADYAAKIEATEGKRSRNFLIKPIMNLFRGYPNSKMYRNVLATNIRDQSVCARDVILRSADSVLNSTNNNSNTSP